MITSPISNSKWPRFRTGFQQKHLIDNKLEQMVLTGSMLGTSPTLGLLGILALVVYTVIVLYQHDQPFGIAFSSVILYLICLLLHFIQDYFPKPIILLSFYSIISLLALLSNIFFQNISGNIVLLILAVLLAYRVPLRWSALITVLFGSIVIWNTRLYATLQIQSLLNDPSFLSSTALFICFSSIARTFRTRHLLVLQLQAEMERTAELATVRERTRIARDIHDVLAHSLTVLSIQVQAARQLALHQPERVAGKLDDIANQLRESLAESRRVVGLLHDATTTTSSDDDVAVRLQTATKQFNEHTGITCTFQETGTMQNLANEPSETLQYALREALTNAHRHGDAHHIWVTLIWQKQQVTLTVRDDGRGKDASTDTKGTNNGLSGMRERAHTLGGSLLAEPLTEEAGFQVSISLPFSNVSTEAVIVQKRI